MKPIVYAPQQPSRFDASLEMWIPSMNLNPARRFGDLLVMLPPNLSSMMVAPLVGVLKEKMADFKAEDYLLAVGDPTLIAAAAAIAVRKTGGKLNVLKWDRQTKDYIDVELVI